MLPCTFRRTSTPASLAFGAVMAVLTGGGGAALADCFLKPWYWGSQPPEHYGLRPVMVYDSARNITVEVFSNGRTFEIINDQWLERETAEVTEWLIADKPVGVYRSAREDVLVITAYNEVLSWDGFEWHYLPDSPFPARSKPAVTYDPYRDVVILFGGRPLEGGGQYEDTWEYDGQDWTQIFPPNAPPGRREATMTFDTHRNVAVMFGGTAFVGSQVLFGDTWEYDGQTWKEVDHSAYPSPSPRHSGGMTYHPGLQMTVLLGGIGPDVSPNPDLWLFDGTKWIERFPAETHWANGFADTAYNASKNAIQKLAGHGVYALLETGAFSPTIVQQPLSKSIQHGQPVQFSVGVVADELVLYQWRHNGKPIPGATLSVYTIGSVMPEHMGAYDCVITPAGFGDVYCGKSVSIAATLVVTPMCAADLTGDGNVGIPDLLQLLGSWGPCP